MEKDTLELDVQAGLSQNEIAKKHNLSQTTIRYWLDKHGLESTGKSGPYRSSVKYTHCQLCTKPTPTNTRNRRLCGACRTKIRRVLAKNAAIKYLGGACARCGYDKHPAAMEFHHRNGKQDKEFTIGGVSNRKWEVIKKELEKCELLCSNCHRVEHSNRTEPEVLKEAARYKGRKLVT